MKSDPYIAWFYQPGERWPRYAVVHSSKISSEEHARAEQLLAAGKITEDYCPIVFLDESLDTPEVRLLVQTQAVVREPPAE